MCSAIRAVLTGLKIQRTTVFASDFDNLSKNLGVVGREIVPVTESVQSKIRSRHLDQISNCKPERTFSHFSRRDRLLPIRLFSGIGYVSFESWKESSQ